MLNVNDFKEKQVVVIGSEDMGENIRFSNDNLVLDRNGKKNNQLSCHKILAVFVLGNTTITSNFLKQAKSFGISVFLMNRNFFCYASIDALAEGNYLLRERQYLSKRDFSMAKKLVENKIINQLKLLECGEKLDNYKKRKTIALEKLKEIKNEKSLLGFEGNFSKEFFGCYFDEMNWLRRAPRTKSDEVNLLLDMGYTFLFNYIDSLLRLYGFDVYKGFYHKFFFKRKSLSCDIMEPFRCLIDRSIVKMNNLKIFNEKDFKFEKGKYILPWENSKKYSRVFLEEIISNKLDIYNYVLSFYRFMMKDEEPFPKFNPKFR